MKSSDDIEELRRSSIRVKALLDLYEKMMNEEITSEKDFQVKKTKAEYLRKEILKATTANDKLLRKIASE